MALLFCADDKFVDVVAVLEARGWRRLPHVGCPKFHLKWTNYSRLNWTRVASTQIVNHLQHAVFFSRKDLFAALLYSRAAQPAAPGGQRLAVDGFFPRTFDLTRPYGLSSLKRWFLYSRALSILKRSAAGHEDVDASLLASAVAVTRRVLAQENALENWWLDEEESSVESGAKAPWDLDVNWRSLEAETQSIDSLHCDEGAPEVDAIARHDVDALLQQLKQRDPQFDALGASASGNVWICKPASLSQGRGIVLTSSLQDLEKLVTSHELSENQHDTEPAATPATRWIVQKYIERPLLMQRGRKFDVRQWVLITALEPQPKVFWYHQSYLRFCMREFSLTRLQDRFTHLSNYSIQRELVPEVTSDADKLRADSPSENDESSVEAMWSSDRFRESLRQEHGRDVWTETLEPQMKHATRQALAAVLPKLQTVGRGFEWLGLDFLVDESLRVWLLEVNVSPDVSHSTDVTAKMAPKATKDALTRTMDPVGLDYGFASFRGIVMLEPDKPHATDNGWLPFQL